MFTYKNYINKLFRHLSEMSFIFHPIGLIHIKFQKVLPYNLITILEVMAPKLFSFQALSQEQLTLRLYTQLGFYNNEIGSLPNMKNVVII